MIRSKMILAGNYSSQNRTFKRDEKYHNKVGEDQLIRVLNAFAWLHEGIYMYNECS